MEIWFWVCNCDYPCIGNKHFWYLFVIYFFATVLIGKLNANINAVTCYRYLSWVSCFRFCRCLYSMYNCWSPYCANSCNEHHIIRAPVDGCLIPNSFLFLHQILVLTILKHTNNRGLKQNGFNLSLYINKQD